MRAALALSACVLSAACSSTTLAEPQILVSPYLAVHQLRGKTSMQSAPGGVVQDNAPQSMHTFGQDRHDDDYGVRVDIGDGFGGLRMDYLKLDMSTSKHGTLDADWGALQSGDFVRMTPEMDEFRIGYLEPLLSTSTEWRDKPMKLQVAAGAVYAYRTMDLRARTEDGARTQNVAIDGHNLYPAVRFKATWREFALDVDYAISPDLDLGGEMEGTLQDFEIRASYAVPLRDVTFFAGWRYSDLEAAGTEGGLRYDADLVLDGFQFGVTVTF